MLLHRYHSLDEIKGLDIETGRAIIEKAKEKEKDERIFLQWLVQLPAMALSGEAVSLDDYRAQVTGANIDTRPTAEILAELAEVERSFSREEACNGT